MSAVPSPVRSKKDVLIEGYDCLASWTAVTDVDRRRQRLHSLVCAIAGHERLPCARLHQRLLGTGAFRSRHRTLRSTCQIHLVNLNFRDILFGCADRSCGRAAQTRTLSMCGKNVVVLDDPEQSKNTHGSLEAAISMQFASESAELFRHLNADKAALYRCIMDVFAAAKGQYRLQLRPDEVLA